MNNKKEIVISCSLCENIINNDDINYTIDNDPLCLDCCGWLEEENNICSKCLSYLKYNAYCECGSTELEEHETEGYLKVMRKNNLDYYKFVLDELNKIEFN